MKKFYAIIGAIIGSFVLLIAKTCSAAATSLFSWNATDTTDLATQILQTWTDFKTPVILVLAVALGFVIILKVVGIIKRSAR